MSDDAISTAGLTKRYGRTAALTDVSLHVERGEVLGYLGPNGAGKTTTIRLLLGLLRPSSGSAEILGHDVQTDGVAARAQVSYLPSEDALYDHMSGRQYLDTFARLGGRPIWRRAELVDRLNVDLAHKIKALSSGNRQKVAIVRALQADVPVYVLDEPTRGLDPLIQREFGQIIREFREAGRTVFLSTHVLSEAEDLCDRVAIVRRGQLLTVESVASITDVHTRRFTVRFGGAPPADADLPGATILARRDHELEFEVSGSPDAIVKALARHDIVDLMTDEPGLEDVFLRFYSEDAGA